MIRINWNKHWLPHSESWAKYHGLWVECPTCDGYGGDSICVSRYWGEWEDHECPDCHGECGHIMRYRKARRHTIRPLVRFDSHEWTRAMEKQVVDLVGERDALRGVLKEIVTITDRKHDAWDRAKALLPTPKVETLPGCDCPKCGRGHMVEEIQFAGFTKCDHCGHSDPF